MSAETIRIFSGDLTLMGTVAIPGGPARVPGVLVLGAHPMYGGERGADVASSISDALLAAGLATLRYDYRGVGENDGSPDKGIGETDDSVSALNALSLHDRIDGSRLGVAGYAFGGSVALRVAEADPSVLVVAAIACPLRALTEAASAEVLAPKLVVGAEEDHDLPVDQFRFLSRRLSEPNEVEIIYGADHFFTDHMADLSDIVVEFFKRRLL